MQKLSIVELDMISGGHGHTTAAPGLIDHGDTAPGHFVFDQTDNTPAPGHYVADHGHTIAAVGDWVD